MPVKNKLLLLLYFSKRESRGALVLISLCFALMILPDHLLSCFWKSASVSGRWRQELSAQLQNLENKSEPKDTLLPFDFDPNEVSLEELDHMNFPPAVARTLVNYRNKGGRFREREDLLKIYGLDTALYRRLEPHIRIKRESRNTFSRQPSKKTVKKALPEPIDINTADKEAWQKFYGIGPVLSGRIIKFREALGGFSRIEQVGETYGLADSVFQSIRPHLKLERLPLSININQCDLETLARHPYISWKLARRLLRYRQQHGPFDGVEDMKGIKELPDDFFEKVAPYFSY